MSEHATQNAESWVESIVKMLASYDAATDGDERNCAENAILDSILSVLVRNAWRDPGLTDSDVEEFELLLTIGGPGLRIVGTLHDYTPETASLEWQDWGTPWTLHPAGEEMLLRFAGFFWYGG